MKRGLLLLLIGLLLLPIPALGAQESPDAAPSPSAAGTAAPAFSTPEPAAETLPLTEDAEEARATPLSAAEVAERMRQAGADADVTGNGTVDEADAIAMLLHVTGRLPDLAALPAVLSDSLLGEKHLERFSYTGVQQGEGFYRSALLCCGYLFAGSEPFPHRIRSGHLQAVGAGGGYGEEQPGHRCDQRRLLFLEE